MPVYVCPCTCVCMHTYERTCAFLCVRVHALAWVCTRVSAPLLTALLLPLPLPDDEPWRQCRAARRDALIPASTPVLRWEESLGFLHLTGPQVTCVSRGPGCCQPLACGGPAGQFHLSSLSPLQSRSIHSGVSKSACHQASKILLLPAFHPLAWVVYTAGGSAGAALSSCLTGRRQSGP